MPTESSESRTTPATSAQEATWPPDLSEERLRAGARIGNYRLIEQIGAGGMGVVYRAEQTHPVQRTVAVKLMKLGTHSPQIVARFEAERQALAMLEHPGIARVYDAGTSDLARPYFVMEFVAGRPINEYCDEHRLSTAARLQLFQDVCQAVQHAHYKGILHRDLKPSNILVTDIDPGAPGQVKIIDFGIAKLMQDSSNAAFMTSAGQFVGTPAYTSPEQAAGEDVDTRADVYSLGVVLYELLSGALPVDASSYNGIDSVQVARRILESDPPLPSTRLSSLGDDAIPLARVRDSDASALCHQLRGDLDRIVMKAIRKDRTQRYATPLAVAEDIRRHLNHELILARPPTLAYQARKFARRNRVLVGATAVVLAAIIAGAAAAMIGLVRARQALAREARALKDEQAARQVSQNVSQFLGDMLASVDPKRAQGKPVLVRDILDQAAAELPKKFAAQPMVAASLHDIISQTYHGLGFFDLSLPHARAALDLYRQIRGEGDPETIRAIEQLAKVLRVSGRADEAEGLLIELVKQQRARHGPEDIATAQAEEALGVVLLSLNRAAEARPLIQHSVEVHRRVLGHDDDQTLGALHNLGAAENALGDFRAAEAAYRQVSESRQQTAGPDHPLAILTQRNLATSLLRQKRAAEAEPILRNVLERSERVLGADHEDTRAALNTLATTVRQLERTEEAEALFRDLVARCRRALAANDPDLIQAVASLGLILEHQEKYDQAIEQYRQACEMLRSADVSSRPAALYTKSYALLLVKAGRLAEAEQPLLDAKLRLEEAGLDRGSIMREVLFALAKVCDASGRAAEAESWQKQSAELATPATISSTQPGSR